MKLHKNHNLNNNKYICIKFIALNILSYIRTYYGCKIMKFFQVRKIIIN